MWAYLLVLLCVVTSLRAVSSSVTKSAMPAKRYKVDLDAPATERWIPVLRDFERSKVFAAINDIETTYIKNKELLKLIDKIAADLDRYFPQPYADEIKGIANYYNVSIGQVVLENIVYDVAAWDNTHLKNMGCTSIVTMDKEGKIIHGRNLDYYSASKLRDVTIEVEFHHSGKTVLIGTTYVGYIGILTAMKPNAFTISGNERDVGSFWENVLSALERHWPSWIMAREIAIHADSYESALQMAIKEDTIAPMYLIIGGIKPHEGAIVVRDRWGAVNVTTMKDSYQWFVLETNYDPWKSPPASDDRRDTGVYAMKMFGQSRMNFDNLYGVLSIPPVFNVQTTYTTLMSAVDVASYRTLIRYDHPQYGT